MKTCFCFQFDGSLLATGSYDGYARLWSTDGKITYIHDSDLIWFYTVDIIKSIVVSVRNYRYEKT